MQKKILILYTSSGYGHMKIAENIGNALRRDYEVDLLNIFEVESGRLVNWGTKLYLWILSSWPELWNFFYTNQLFLRLTLPLRRPLAGFRSKKIAAILLQKNYDFVISTQVNASAIISFLKKKRLLKGLFAVTFSDFHLHPYWLFDNVDLYLANVEEQKTQMLARGIPANKIAVCGITLSPKIESATDEALTHSVIKARMQINLNDKVLLVLGGGRGLGITKKVITDLTNIKATVIVVCGKNEELRNKLLKLWAGDAQKKVIGFTENMSELYLISDLVISKPGGLSVAECLQYFLPIAVPNYLPGQEKFNFEYLKRNSLILDARSDLKKLVDSELASGEFAKQLRTNRSVAELVQLGEPVYQAITNRS